ncbi:MAG: hypothetical protein VB138_01875 [Burkholderia sp.]
MQGMISLTKTAHSSFFRDQLSSGQPIEFKDKFFEFAYQVIGQGHDKKKNAKARESLNRFRNFVKVNSLKFVTFSLSYDTASNKYHFCYQLQSIKFETEDFRVDSYIDDTGAPFAFYPQLFSTDLLLLLSQVPVMEIVEMAHETE